MNRWLSSPWIVSSHPDPIASGLTAGPARNVVVNNVNKQRTTTEYTANSLIENRYSGLTKQRRTSFSYDSHNRLQQTSTYLKTGTNQVATSTYGYDFNGVLTYQQDPKGNVTTTTVNTLGLPQVQEAAL